MRTTAHGFLAGKCRLAKPIRQGQHLTDRTILSEQSATFPRVALDDPAKETLNKDDIKDGMSVMQTVYAIAMVLGFKRALEESFRRFFPVDVGHGLLLSSEHLPCLVVVASLAAIMALGLRFFWVPRNMYAYLKSVDLKPRAEPIIEKPVIEKPVIEKPVIAKKRLLSERRRKLRPTAICHFPMVLLHAVLYFCVCNAYAELVTSGASLESARIAKLASLFVLVFAGLLLLNGVWLLTLAYRSKRQPQSPETWVEKMWGYNNLTFVVLTVGWYVFFEVTKCVSMLTFITVACGLLLANSAIDLWNTAPFYILHDE